jgi:hypothetical protein
MYSVSVSKPTTPAMVAAVLAISLLAGAKEWPPCLLSSHKATPASTMQAAEFGAIVCAAPQQKRIAMLSVHPINAANPIATEEIAAREA